MVSYWFAWLPAAVVVGGLTLLAVPYLALIVVFGVLCAAIVAIGPLLWEAASAVYRLPRRVAGAPERATSEPAPVPAEPGSAHRLEPDRAGAALGPYAGTP